MNASQNAHMRLWSCEDFPLILPAGHPFPNLKYPLLEEELKAQGFGSLIFRCKMASREVLELVHDKDYIDRVIGGNLQPDELRRVGFPWSENYVRRARASVEATFQATQFVLTTGGPVAGALAGGTHHAYRDHGEGYCTFNDIAICAVYALKHFVDRVMVVDLDAHQGNGTAAIFSNEPRVFTLSLHCDANYPRAKERSSLDVGLDIGTGDEAYLNALSEHLLASVDYFRPELVFFQSGVDVLAADRFGKLGLSLDGLWKRDCFVFETFKTRSIPVVITLGGGYQSDHRAVARAHAQTFMAARQIFEGFRPGNLNADVTHSQEAESRLS